MPPPDRPTWHPERLAARLPFLRRRALLTQATRAFFLARGYTEVETPYAVPTPGEEVHLHAFATKRVAPDGATQPLWLHTSPEFAMKKLLAAGERRIWQLARVFRNGERGATHHPEFTMLEWYRAHASYRDLMDDCETLLRDALTAAGAATFRWQGRSADPKQPWQRVSLADAFQRWCGIDLVATAPDPERPSLERLTEAARPLGIAPHAGDDWEDLFFRIFLARIEPKLGVEAPTILYDYPISMAALARPKPEDPRLAERFEVYVCGLELANAFGELTDAALQRQRFQQDQARKQARYGFAYPIDEDFLAALAYGMPPSAGIALGFDRLVMLATGTERIEDVLWAPVA